jgi:transposase InsO family protein
VGQAGDIGDAEAAELIRQIQKDHRYRYGVPRVREELRRGYGKRVSRKKAASLMRENGLNARGKRKFSPPTDSNYGLAVCGNRLNREFHAERAGGEMGVGYYLPADPGRLGVSDGGS